MAAILATNQQGRPAFTVTVANTTGRVVKVHPLHAQPGSIQLYIRKVGDAGTFQPAYPLLRLFRQPPPIDLPAKSETPITLPGYPEAPGVYDCYFTVTLHEVGTEPPSTLTTNTLRITVRD